MALFPIGELTDSLLLPDANHEQHQGYYGPENDKNPYVDFLVRDAKYIRPIN